MKTLFRLALASATALSAPALAQDHSAMDHGAMDHGTMDHGSMDHAPATPDPSAHAGMNHGPGGEDTICLTYATIPHYADGSGTARLPGYEGTVGGGCSGPASRHAPGGLHAMAGDWMVMAHGFVTANYTDHSGPRGDDKLYSTSMAMLMAENDTGWGRIQLKSMLSLEPLMDARGYPNLFATGETANGEPLVDRQHPHDLFMELAGRVDVNVAQGTSLFVYGGPVGEPAIGPSAFMHRGSARYNPEPPITHHWFDSTHITYGVVTAGVSSAQVQIEASAFRGAEPDEDRWDIESPKLDSWSVRGTYSPDPRWTFQASYAQIKEPEALHPGEDEDRFTASAHYADRSGLSAMAAFSAKNRQPGRTLSAWLGEVNWDLDGSNTLFGRVENVANDELFPEHDADTHGDAQHDDTVHGGDDHSDDGAHGSDLESAYRVTKLQAGYARRFALDPFELALGGSVNLYAKPAALDKAYGRTPWGYTLFARLSLGK